MGKPQGTLTQAQYEIMQAVWLAQAGGATVAETRQTIAEQRPVGRTTVLNQVHRLEKRGWLKRQPGAGVNRYIAAVGSEAAARRLAGQFVDDFSAGSASRLVMGPLSAERLSGAAIDRLRRPPSAGRRGFWGAGAHRRC